MCPTLCPRGPNAVASNLQDEEGRIPRTVDVELTEDLIGCCVAGDVVTVLGKVK